MGRYQLSGLLLCIESSLVLFCMVNSPHRKSTTRIRAQILDYQRVIAGAKRHPSTAGSINENGELDLRVIICRLLQFPAHQDYLCYQQWLDIYPARSNVKLVMNGTHCPRWGIVELGRRERGSKIRQAVIHIVLLHEVLSYIQIIPPTSEIDRDRKPIWKSRVMDLPREQYNELSDRRINSLRHSTH
ncbi:hypothetical protein BDV27DRAFT_118682 [Aspergillus caelatus]|uniref:Uncharacterized protein n=1 Tax=Aspergillus caelatus TaxID=61420 RepID=A0A5N7A4E2_9EURO|nr:uncharacterized protein BDV27DRAFT_118682 [Aspergillus caelatus]KAE8364059.1 hypothetical protein BDV27DRAFT_118682 [Aspergillus caelatus]